ncbi:hypothetical protein [Mycoplasmoides pirum]|uniref:hypothetical protein n=1 Tax=Mycoplasmoides pirum TaxID=2122 RepID=UPI000480F43A|nr:hypothetical protein [Mycoplasmoides pirum]
MNKIKRSKFFTISSLLGISLISLTLVSVINLDKNINEIDSNNSLVNQNISSIKNIVNPQPLTNITDLKITSQSIETGRINTEEVTDADGNYILTATNQSNNKAKIVKLNFQLQYLYQWEYNVLNYQTRQIVADTEDIGYYYALLVNDQVSLNIQNSNNTTANNIKFTIQNPALVVQLYDTGSSFEQRNIYNLDLPNFAINNKNNISNNVANNGNNSSNEITDSQAADNIWDHIYVQEAIQKDDTNEKLSFIRNTTTSNSTAKNIDSTNNVYINSDTKSVIYKLLGNSGKKNNNSTNSNEHDYYILKQLYLNNANNMVYLKDEPTNRKMILIFGGNAYQSFWFYDFIVSINGKSSKYVTPMLYANYDFNPFNIKNSTSEILYSTVQKNWYYLPFMRKNKISNLAWYVGGAKTITIKNLNSNDFNSYVFLAMMQPNVSDFNKDLVDNYASVTDDIKKGTYATAEHVTKRINPSINGSSGTANSGMVTINNNQNDNPQNTNNNAKYNNKEILVGSSSINASFELFFPIGSYNSSDYVYPFSAIQSLTILPVMTSSIASIIANEPHNENESIQEKIYLSTYDEIKTENNFSLFNAIYKNNKYYHFDFGKKFYITPSNWLEEKTSPSFPNAGTIISSNVGEDYWGFSRVLLNTNPINSSNYFEDGWNNSASQKIVSFSAQLSNNILTNEYGKFNQVIATMIIRGYIISFTYDFELIKGIAMAPVANLNENVLSTNLKPSHSSVLNNFQNLLSISQANNTWSITYQKDNNSSTYVLSYLNDSLGNFYWSIYVDPILNTTNDKIAKNLTANNNFIQIKDNKTIYIKNSIKGEIQLNNGLSINNNVDIWGKLEQVSSQYLNDSNLISKTTNEILKDKSLLNQLVNYSGGWSANSNGLPTTNEPFLIFNAQSYNSTITFDVALKFVNGKYYTSANVDSNLYPNIIQNSALNIPVFKYDGFAVLASWVIPAIIGGIVFLVLLFVVIGILIVLSMHKNKKTMQRGFVSTNKKVETLTTAVGSVYKKILVQTKNNKSPQMLKAAKKPNTVLKRSQLTNDFASKSTVSNTPKTLSKPSNSTCN